MPACSLAFLIADSLLNEFVSAVYEEGPCFSTNFFFCDPVVLELICYRTRAKRLINEGNTTGGLRKIWTGYGFLKNYIYERYVNFIQAAKIGHRSFLSGVFISRMCLSVWNPLHISFFCKECPSIFFHHPVVLPLFISWFALVR